MKTFQQFTTEAFAPQLFHKDIGIPASLQSPRPGMILRHGFHSKDRAAEKGIAALPNVLPSDFTIIEIESTQGQSTKWVVRFTYDALNDIVLVVLPDGFCKTAWLNAKSDKHNTLKRHLYTHPSQFRVH